MALGGHEGNLRQSKSGWWTNKNQLCMKIKKSVTLYVKAIQKLWKVRSEIDLRVSALCV